MDGLLPITYQCASCGEENETLVDPGGGYRQSYTEDCAICCRPNVLHLVLSPDGDVAIDVEFEE